MNEFYKTNHHYALQAPHNVREIDLYANLRWSGGLVVLFRFFFCSDFTWSCPFAIIKITRSKESVGDNYILSQLLQEIKDNVLFHR